MAGTAGRPENDRAAQLIIELGRLVGIALTEADQATQWRAGALARAAQYRSINRAAKPHPGRSQAQLAGVSTFEIAGSARGHRAQRKLAGYAPARIVLDVVVGKRPNPIGRGLADVDNSTTIEEPRGLQHARGVVDRAAGNADACARIDHRFAG